MRQELTYESSIQYIFYPSATIGASDLLLSVALRIGV